MKKKLKKSIVTKAVKKKVVKKKAVNKKVVKKKIIVSKVKVKKPTKKTDSELRKIERPFIRYGFIVESLKVDKNNIIEEIIFEYKGPMVIPKSQKDNYKSGSSSVQGTYIIKEDSIDLVCSRDFNTVKKTEIIKHLLDNVREGYILDMRKTIKKELMPEYKIITKLPW